MNQSIDSVEAIHHDPFSIPSIGHPAYIPHHRSLAPRSSYHTHHKMAHEDDAQPQQPAAQQPQAQAQQQQQPAEGGQPSDEEVGLAVLDAARYGDLEDLQELAQTYGARHLGFQGSHNGGNTALHYGGCGERMCFVWWDGGAHRVKPPGPAQIPTPSQPAPTGTWPAPPGCSTRAWRGGP